MDYQELAEKLEMVSPEGTLYDQLCQSILGYSRALVDLGEARARKDPRRRHFKEQADGRFSDLVGIVTGINAALISHDPPLEPLPISKEDLTPFVSDFIRTAFERRR